MNVSITYCWLPSKKNVQLAGKSATKPAISQAFYLENPAEARRRATFFERYIARELV